MTDDLVDYESSYAVLLQAGFTNGPFLDRYTSEELATWRREVAEPWLEAMRKRAEADGLLVRLGIFVDPMFWSVGVGLLTARVGIIRPDGRPYDPGWKDPLPPSERSSATGNRHLRPHARDTRVWSSATIVRRSVHGLQRFGLLWVRRRPAPAAESRLTWTCPNESGRSVAGMGEAAAPLLRGSRRAWLDRLRQVRRFVSLVGKRRGRGVGRGLARLGRGSSSRRRSSPGAMRCV